MYIGLYEYDPVKQDYVYIHSMKNPIQKKYQKKEINVEEAKKKLEDKLKQLFGDIEFVDEVIEEEVKVGPIKGLYSEEISIDED